MIYHNALGVARDPGRAAYWWQRAASKGEPDAQAMLGAAHHIGAGVGHEPILALAWLIRAMRGGSELAAPFVQAVRAALTPEQIAEAEHLAHEPLDPDAAA
jgi:TPR repeat protein